MRAAILARVSDKKQAAADRHSLPVQLAEMNAIADRFGHEVVREFRIEGESAFKELIHRPEFTAALEAAERHEFDVLFVYDFSRFARNNLSALVAIDRLRKAGVQLFGAYSGLDYTDPANEDQVMMESLVSSRSSRDHQRRVKFAFERRHALGYPTGDVPFGYVSIGTDKAPVAVPEEAEAIEWAFRHYAAGGGYVAMAEEFNRRGLKPRSKRGYEGFVASSCQRIIQNRFYCGFVSHLGNERKGAHERIVDEELWTAANAQIQHWRRTKHETTLLTGIASCAVCGGPIWTSGWDSRRVNRYYREPSHQQLRVCANARTQWPNVEPDGQVDATMLALSPESSEPWRRYILDGLAVEDQRRGPTSDDLIARRDRATEAYVAGLLKPDAWRATVAEVNTRLAALPQGPTAIMGAVGTLSTWCEAWAGFSMAEKRKAVRIVFDRIALDTREKKLWVHPRPGEYAQLVNLRAAFAGPTPDRTRSQLQQIGFYLPSELGLAA